MSGELKHGIRLADCGDQMTAEEYAAWMIQSPNTIYQQVSSASCLVTPWTLKPLRWRRADCEAKIAQRDLVIHQRRDRAKKRLGLVKAS